MPIWRGRSAHTTFTFERRQETEVVQVGTVSLLVHHIFDKTRDASRRDTLALALATCHTLAGDTVRGRVAARQVDGRVRVRPRLTSTFQS